MPIIDLPEDATPEADKLADGFRALALQKFEETRDEVYDLVQKIWYRNRDADGNGVLTGDETSGEQILNSLGTDAKLVYEAAKARATMVVTIATLAGKPEEVDLSKVSGPAIVTFHPDGSVDQITYT